MGGCIYAYLGFTRGNGTPKAVTVIVSLISRVSTEMGGGGGGEITMGSENKNHLEKIIVECSLPVSHIYLLSDNFGKKETILSFFFSGFSPPAPFWLYFLKSSSWFLNALALWTSHLEGERG